MHLISILFSPNISSNGLARTETLGPCPLPPTPREARRPAATTPPQTRDLSTRSESWPTSRNWSSQRLVLAHPWVPKPHPSASPPLSFLPFPNPLLALTNTPPRGGPFFRISKTLCPVSTNKNQPRTQTKIEEEKTVAAIPRGSKPLCDASVLICLLLSAL
jgi:hypothetical protein